DAHSVVSQDLRIFVHSHRGTSYFQRQWSGAARAIELSSRMSVISVPIRIDGIKSSDIRSSVLTGDGEDFIQDDMLLSFLRREDVRPKRVKGGKEGLKRTLSDA